MDTGLVVVVALDRSVFRLVKISQHTVPKGRDSGGFSSQWKMLTVPTPVAAHVATGAHSLCTFS